jgi:hypothetical protein
MSPSRERRENDTAGFLGTFRKKPLRSSYLISLDTTRDNVEFETKPVKSILDVQVKTRDLPAVKPPPRSTTTVIFQETSPNIPRTWLLFRGPRKMEMQDVVRNRPT